MPAIAADTDLAASFAADGFAVARSLFGADDVARLNHAFGAQAARGPVPGLFDGDPAAAGDPLARLPRMMHPHRHPALEIGPLAMATMLDPRVGGILTALLGEPAIATQSMYYFKPPGARGQALHQDNFYLVVQPGTCVAAWLALDDADEENGGMVVVPGSHRHRVYCPQQADMSRSFSSHYVPAPEGMSEEPVRLRAGDVLFFNGSLIHGSYENRSADRFRRAFICHYMPSSATSISEWYRPLFAFDGQEVQRAFTNAGGACGEAITAPH
jgi:ectoine hydroxylase-related dioxygenase (phytanoyl-CoA dioxygenase family)